MRKSVTIYLLLSILNVVYATNYYLDKNATGLNNGTSWANAWKSTSYIDWAKFQGGDTLFISGGVYPQWTISGKTSTNGYRYIVGAYQSGHNNEVIFRNTSNSTPTIFFGWDPSSNIWIENITVESPTGTTDEMSAIYVAYGNKLVFNKVFVHTCLASNRISHGFNLAESKNIEINNSTIMSDSNTVSREQDGIIVGNANEGYFKFNNNKIILAGWTSTENPHRDGIQFWTDKSTAAIIDVTVSNNFIFDKVNTTKRSMSGLYTYGVAGNFYVFNNVIRLKGYEYTSAISIQAGNFTNQNLSANIYNNTIIVDYQQYPLEAVGCDTLRAKNNIVMRTSNTFYLTWELSNCSYKDINFNQYYAPAGSSNSFRINGSEKSFSYWQSTLGFDKDGEWNAVSFANKNGTNKTDYKLVATSNGINKGNNILLFNTDIEGISRPQGGAWDRGAFEYKESSSILDTTPPQLMSAAVINPTTIELTFSEALENSSVLVKSNYSINNGVIVDSVSLSIDGKKVTLNTSPNIANTTYTLIVSNIKDLGGNVISPNHNSLQYSYVGDNTPPILLSVSILDSITVELTFSEQLDNNSALNKLNYSIDNGVSVVNAALSSNQSKVILKTTNHIPNLIYTLYVKNISDLSGNLISDNNNFMQYQYYKDIIPPDILGVVATNTKSLTIKFSEKVDINSAKNKNNYQISNNISINQVQLLPDSLSVLLKTSPLQYGSSYTLTVANVKDRSGNQISPNPKTCSFSQPAKSNGKPTQNIVTKAIASSWYQSLSPDKSIDGQLMENPLSRWSGNKEMPDTIDYDMGENCSLDSIRISFYKWDTNRLYKYSVFCSENFDNWKPIVEGIWSEDLEWTSIKFENTNTRYIKLIILESTQGSWASIWEIQVFGPINNDSNGKSNLLPYIFELSQNYPNPFNPTTKIKVQLPKNIQMRLVVYNMLGELVNVVADGEYQAGVNEFNFDATGLSSGVYVYRIESPDFVDTKKMILLR